MELVNGTCDLLAGNGGLATRGYRPKIKSVTTSRKVLGTKGVVLVSPPNLVQIGCTKTHVRLRKRENYIKLLGFQSTGLEGHAGGHPTAEGQ
jgi:hypothetical protein